MTTANLIVFAIVWFLAGAAALFMLLAKGYAIARRDPEAARRVLAPLDADIAERAARVAQAERAMDELHAEMVASAQALDAEMQGAVARLNEDLQRIEADARPLDYEPLPEYHIAGGDCFPCAAWFTASFKNTMPPADWAPLCPLCGEPLEVAYSRPPVEEGATDVPE